MKEFIGIKRIKAEAESREGVDGYKVVYEDGYESWSPKEVFEEALPSEQKAILHDRRTGY